MENIFSLALLWLGFLSKSRLRSVYKFSEVFREHFGVLDCQRHILNFTKAIYSSKLKSFDTVESR